MVGDNWFIEAQIDKVQPKSCHWLESPFCIGAKRTQTVEINVIIFSDNLPEPEKQIMAVDIESTSKKVDLDKIIKLDYERFEASPEYEQLIRKIEADA